MASPAAPERRDTATSPDGSWRAMRTALAAESPTSDEPKSIAGVLKICLPGSLYMAVKHEPEMTLQQVLEVIAKKRSVSTVDTYFQLFDSPDSLPLSFEVKMGELTADKIRLVELKSLSSGALAAMLLLERQAVAAKAAQVVALQAELASSKAGSADVKGEVTPENEVKPAPEVKPAVEPEVKPEPEARVPSLETELAAAKAAQAHAQAAAEQAKAELAKSQADFDALKQAHSSLQESKNELSAFIERSEAENQELSSLVSKLEEDLATSQQQSSTGSNGAADAELAEVKAQLAAVTSELETIKTLSAGTLAEYETLFQESATIRSQLEAANAELEQVRAKRASLEQQLAEERQRHEKVINEKAAAAAGSSNATATVAELQTALIAATKQRVEALEKELADKESQVKTLTTSLVELRAQVEVLEREKRENASRVAAAQNAKAELEQLKKETRGRDMKRMMIERESEAVAEDKQDQIDEMKQQLEELQRELEAMRCQEKVCVKVIEAKDFRAGGKSDPFVELGIKGQARSTYRTQVLKKNYRPAWNEEFALFPEHHEKDTLWVKLLDWDIGKNELIGELELPLGLFYRRQSKEDWHTFRTGSMVGPKGEIKLQVSYGIIDEPEVSALKAKLAAAQAEIESLRASQVPPTDAEPTV
eukprot:TRINITY_DN14479_c0_g1_i1.p1 TRINITY_DN14479_c0_g1~~TRINITY_DN14479_c0_g1_i1.p1  ORF type:complete len:654 (-),score=202.08 TRINITY_DN14479_c0_g1_i1:591-2552(-)